MTIIINKRICHFPRIYKTGLLYSQTFKSRSIQPQRRTELKPSILYTIKMLFKFGV